MSKYKKNLALICIFSVIVTVMIVYATMSFIKSAKANGERAFGQFSEQIAFRVDDQMQVHSKSLMLLKDELEHHVLDSSFTKVLIDRYIANGDFEEIGAITDDGHIISRDGNLISMSGEIEIEIEGEDSTFFTSGVNISKESINGKEKIIFYTQCKSSLESKEIIGIFGYIPLSGFSDLLEDTAYGDEGSFIAMVDRKGETIWYGSNTMQEYILSKNFFDDLTACNAENSKIIPSIMTAMEQHRAGYAIYEAGGIEKGLAYRPLNHNNWYLVVVTPHSEIFDLSKLRNGFILLIGGVLLLVAMFVFLVWGYKSNAIKLQASREESRFKSEFLSNMSHEIRTPLNGVAGIVQILKNMEYDDENRLKYLDYLEVSANQLKAVVNDVLDMSKIESGKMDIKNERFDLESLSMKTVALYKLDTEKKGVTFKTDISEIGSKFYVGDENCIWQILTNLLSNAVKFTSRGEISLTIKEEKTAKNENVVTFVVSDTGTGMSEDFLSHIYEPFVQGGNSDNMVLRGTGLGLAIVNELLKLMNGTIKIESVLCKGTQIKVSIPMEPSKNQHEEKTKKFSIESQLWLKGKKILLVEDNKINAAITKKLLTAVGTSVVVAENGKEAIECFRQCEGKDIDLILMDVRMPVMNGLEATRKIRNFSNPMSKSIPIIALTANGLDEDNRTILEAGMNERISKPIDINEFYEVVGKYINI